MISPVISPKVNQYLIITMGSKPICLGKFDAFKIHFKDFVLLNPFHSSFYDLVPA